MLLNQRKKLMENLVHGILPWYRIFFQRDRKPWRRSMGTLQLSHPGTLGHELSQFLVQNGFHLMPLFERHDVYHVLLGYGTDALEEAQMQFFLLGNGKRSPGVLLAAIGAGFLLPEYAEAFRRVWLRGTSARSIGEWEFEYLLGEQLEELRNFIFACGNPKEVPFF